MKFVVYTRTYVWIVHLFQTLDVLIENTGDIPVIVQMLPLHLYPNPQTIVDLLKHKYVLLVNRLQDLVILQQLKYKDLSGVPLDAGVGGF